MTDLYRNKYKISSARLKGWNYADAGMYFITICTADRNCFFGEIAAPVVKTPGMASLPPGKIKLSEIGKIAETEWLKTIELRADMNVELGEFVIMPNHFHGILIIGDNQFNRNSGFGRDAMHRVSTTTAITTSINEPANEFKPQSKNLASVIRGYKSAVTTYARKNNILFNWQSRFHDHIIRLAEEYDRISYYIMNNVLNWQQDKFYKF